MNHSRHIFLLAIAISSSLFSPCFSQTAARFRTWTDATGKYTVEAKFLEIKLGKVKLQRRNGKVIEISLTRHVQMPMRQRKLWLARH